RPSIFSRTVLRQAQHERMVIQFQRRIPLTLGLSKGLPRVYRQPRKERGNSESPLLFPRGGWGMSSPQCQGRCMVEALLISNIVLWLVTVTLAAVVLALVRQIGVLHERVAPAGALVGRDGPRIGAAAPRFEIPDWTGTPHTIGGPDADGRDTL